MWGGETEERDRQKDRGRVSNLFIKRCREGDGGGCGERDRQSK